MAIARDLQRLKTRWQGRRDRNFRRPMIREIGAGLLGQLYLDRGEGPAATTFLAGHDRSGTTWLAEIVNFGKRYRYLFEPFSPGRLDITEAFRPRQYLRATDRDPRYVEPARAIVSGQVRSLWADKYNRAVLPRKRLIKEVRSNLLLPWLHDLFPGMRIVLALRHPCAVAHSQMSVSSNWKANPSLFLEQEVLVEDHLGPFLDVINGAATDFERHIAVWCIDNYVPLRALGRGDAHVVFYENVCVDPAGEIARLLDYLGDPFDQEVVRVAGRPSATTRRDSAIVSGQSLVDGWRRGVDRDQIAAAVRILRAFGLDRIYGDGSMPLVTDPFGA
ncbi:MAG TPA: sulfotransferase [Actinomycetota bacterium]|nr:sulfotransferase [Actinomycetota bacterium]